MPNDSLIGDLESSLYWLLLHQFLSTELKVVQRHRVVVQGCVDATGKGNRFRLWNNAAKTCATEKATG